MGCCGRSDVVRFAELADLHPRSSREGQRARARLALAMIGVKARALGDLGTLEKVERGFAQLGTVADARAALADRSRSLYAAREGRIVADVDRVFAMARTLLDLVNGIIAAVAAANPADTGLQDATKVTAWINWILGGPLPMQVADADVRIMHTIFSVAGPLLQGIISAAVLALDTSGTNSGLRAASTWITGTWLRGLQSTIAAANAALGPPPPSPMDAARAALEAERTRLAEEAARNAARAQGISWMTMTPAQRAAMTMRFRPLVIPTGGGGGGGGGEPKSSGALLALPAALLAWYLFK